MRKEVHQMSKHVPARARDHRLKKPARARVFSKIYKRHPATGTGIIASVTVPTDSSDEKQLFQDFVSIHRQLSYDLHMHRD
jgi:hypothetical protein